MPRGDGTGPAGMGPMTGRGAGLCAGYATPGFANALGGRGFFGRGRGGGGGGGWGRRNRFHATGLTGWQRAGWPWPVPVAAMPIVGGLPVGAAPTAEQQIETLQNQANYLEESLAEVRRRIEQLHAAGKDE